MLPINKLLDVVNNGLNDMLTEDSNAQFSIFADGGDYEPPLRNGNQVQFFINGVAQISENNIVPINNVLVVTETLSVAVVVAINPDKGVEESVAPIRSVLSAWLAKPQKTNIVQDDKNYSVTIYGSQPQAGELMQRDNVGKSITYTFNVYFAMVQGGISSYDLQIKFDGEDVPFMEANISLAVVAYGGVLSNTGGQAQNYPTSYGLQIDLSVPALENNNLTSDFAKWLITKIRKVHEVEITYAGETGTFNMFFAQSNITAKGLDNIGQSITLIEALGVQNG